MTIQLPPDNILDRILDRILVGFGKRRGIIMPSQFDKASKEFGHHAIIKTRKENFLKALFKRKS